MSWVLDASAVVDMLMRSDKGEPLRRAVAELAGNEVFTVAHLDAEVFSGLARNHRAGLVTASEVTVMLEHLSELAAVRLPITAALMKAAWELREYIAARDALYAAAARHLGFALVTTDERLARAVPDLVHQVS